MIGMYVRMYVCVCTYIYIIIYINNFQKPEALNCKLPVDINYLSLLLQNKQTIL